MYTSSSNFDCIAYTHPEFAELFWNKEDTLKYKYGSNKRASFRCPNCNNQIKNKIIWNIFKDGLSCPKCSDGVSYSEKFVYSLLEQLGVNFEYQKSFIWSKNRKYDFYIHSIDCIIETNGIQHYETTFKNINARSLIKEQENDRLKEILAKENGIEHYIVLDCRKSCFDWIKSSTLSSKLNEMFDLANVNWNQCFKNTCSSMVVKTCDLWNDGVSSTTEISNILRIAQTTVSDYLKRGVVLGWVEYDPKEELRKNGKRQGKINGKSIIQLSLGGQFIRKWESAREINRELGVDYRNISDACRGRIKTSIGYIWLFEEDFEKLNSGEINMLIKKVNKNNIPKKRVVQISLNGEHIKTWDSILDAQQNLKISHISSVCSGKRNKAGGYKWMYEDDFLQMKGGN